MATVSTIFIIVATISFIIGVILLTTSILRFKKAKSLTKTTGTTLIRKGFSIEHGKPVVRYEVGDYTYTYFSPIGHQKGFKHEGKMDVLYNPEDPTDVILDNFVQKGGRAAYFGGILIGISIITSGISIILHLFQ